MKRKLGVDLDQTVIFSDPCKMDGAEFCHEFPNDGLLYFVKRQYAQDFLDWASEKFDLYFVTASTKIYAEFVAEQFNLRSKLKGIISREDLGSKEKIFDEYGNESEEYIKKIDDFIMVDDKPHVVRGSNNILIKISQCWDKKEDDLLRVAHEIEKITFEETNEKVRETISHIYFFGDIFSNFYNCNFTIDNIRYCSVEQYYMSKKTLFFNDEDRAADIMNEVNSLKIKRLGSNKAIKNFNPQQWASVKNNIMLQACVAKFYQNDNLKQILLSTKNKTLVEASPFDFYWGAGVSLNNPLIFDQAAHKGQNQLGLILMKVRDLLSISD